MKLFDIGDPAEWVQVNDPIPLEGNPDNPHLLRLEIMAEMDTAIFASGVDGDNTLIACGHGLMIVKLLVNQPLEIVGSCNFWLRKPGRDFWSEQSDSPKLTSVERRRQRNPEVEKMLALMKVNEARREAAQADEIGRMKALRAAIEAERSPVVDPK